MWLQRLVVHWVPYLYLKILERFYNFHICAVSASWCDLNLMQMIPDRGEMVKMEPFLPTVTP